MSIQRNHPDLAAQLAAAIETLGGQSDEFANAVELAASLATNQLVAGHKLVVLGTPGLASLGELFCHNMLYGDAELRPALPAVSLNATLAMTPGSGRREADADSSALDMRLFLRAAEAVANAGDTLLVLSDSNATALPEALEKLYISRGVHSILMAPKIANGNESAAAHKVMISLECDTVASIQQLCLFILNALADMIEARVFGNTQKL